MGSSNLIKSIWEIKQALKRVRLEAREQPNLTGFVGILEGDALCAFLDYFQGNARDEILVSSYGRRIFGIATDVPRYLFRYGIAYGQPKIIENNTLAIPVNNYAAGKLTKWERRVNRKGKQDLELAGLKLGENVFLGHDEVEREFRRIGEVKFYKSICARV